MLTPEEVRCAMKFTCFILTRTQARSEDAVQRKILEKIATFTTNQIPFEDDDTNASTADSVDPDLVVTTGSDADSSGDGKVLATSIDGEDELVDVSMTDSKAKDNDSKKKDAEENR
jgi:ubiquitin carboxyl-terminal hydrolase 4/11/15